MSVWRRDADGRLVRIEVESKANDPHTNVVDFDEQFCQILNGLRKCKNQVKKNLFNSQVMGIADQIRNNTSINPDAKVKYIGCLADILALHNFGVSYNGWDNSTPQMHHIPCDGSSFHKRNVDRFEYNQENLSLIIKKLHLGRCCFQNVIQTLSRMQVTGLDAIIDKIQMSYTIATNALGLETTKTLPSEESYFDEEEYDSDDDNSEQRIQKKKEVTKIVKWIMKNNCNSERSQQLPNQYPNNIKFAEQYEIRNDYLCNELKNVYEAQLNEADGSFGCASNVFVDFDGDLISVVGSSGYKFRLAACSAHIFERENDYKEKCVLIGMEGFLDRGACTFCDAKENRIWVCGDSRIKCISYRFLIYRFV